MSQPLRVIKVGGSLFDLPDLAQRLHAFFDKADSSRDILIAGGGPLVDYVRRLDGIAPIESSRAHWICIEMMSLTAKLLGARMGVEPVVTQVHDLTIIDQPQVTIFDPMRWLREVEPNASGKKLPVGWEVTSDSIAARLASVLQADELILVKSALPDGQIDLEHLAHAGYVDPVFPRFAGQLPKVTFVNLRDATRLTVCRSENQA